MSEALLTFLHISDTHISHDPEYNRSFATHTPIIGVEALIKEIDALPFTPDFVLHTGDTTYDPVLEAYKVAQEVLEKIVLPIYYVAGNHDDVGMIQKILLGRADSEITSLLHYQFEVNGVQIVVVDSNDFGDHGRDDAEKPSGYVSDRQLEWLDGICTANDDRPLVIAIHHNVLDVGVPWSDEWMGVENGEAVHRIIRKANYRLRGVFHGHVHQNIDTWRDGVLYSACLSSWVQFHAYPGMTHTTPDQKAQPGYSVVSMTRDQTFVRRYTFHV